MKRPDPKAAAVSLARGAGASLAKPLKRAAGGDVKDTLLDSTGKPVHHTPEGVENFKKWFGKSHVINGDGRPWVMNHLTASDFSEFKPGGDDPNLSGPAIWMTPQRENIPAAHNTGYRSRDTGEVDYRSGANVMPLYAKIENPLYIMDEDDLSDAQAKYQHLGAGFPTLFSKESIDAMKKDGYDGVFWAAPSNRGHAPDIEAREGVEVIAFDPSQIKSAIGNDGTWDHPSDITKAEGGEVEPEGDPVLHTSVPNDEWLKSKQEHVLSGGRHPSGAFKRFGSTTGYFRSGPEHEGRRNVMMPVPLLASIPGVMEEQKNVRQHALDWLTDEMGRTGKLPLNSSGEEYAPHVWVNHEGEAFVAEGNHRIMAAQKLGMTHLPVELEYVNGGERVNGPFHPDRILDMHREAASADREGKAEGGQIGQPDRPLAPAATAPQREKYLEGSQVENQRFVEGHDPRLVFHATASTPFNEFNPERSDLGIHVGSLVHAQDRLKSKGNVSDDGVLEQARVIPLYAKAKNLLRLEDHGNFQPANVISQLEDQGILSEKGSTQLLNKMRDQSGPAYPYGIRSSVGERVLREHLKGLGYDGVVYLNRGEGVGDPSLDYWGHVPRDMMSGDYTDQDVLGYYPDAHDSYILFDAGQVKSPNASDYDESEKDYLKASGGEVEGDDEWTEVYPLEPEHAEKLRRDEKAEGGQIGQPGIDAPPPADIGAAREAYLSGTAAINQRPIKGHDPRLLFHSAKHSPYDGDWDSKESYAESSYDFTQFDPERSELGIHLGSRDQAEGRINQGQVKEGLAPRTLPVYASINNPLRLQDNGRFNWRSVFEQLEKKGVMSFKEGKDFWREMGNFDTFSDKSESIGNAKLRDFLKSKGYDGVVYLNRFEGVLKRGKEKSISPEPEERESTFTDRQFLERYPGAHDSYIIFDPPQAKSQFATHYDRKRNELSLAAGGEVEGMPEASTEGMELHALNPEHAEEYIRAYHGKAEGGDVEGTIAKAEGGEVDGQPPAQPVQPAPPARKFNSIGLYSHAAEQALKLPQTRGSLDQMLGALKNKGVKQDEIDFSEAGTMLGGPSATVTKQDLADHFNANMPEFSPQTDTNRFKNWSLQKDEENRRTGGELAGKNYREHLLRLSNPSSDQPPFTAGHWPDVSNITAHLRTQDFKDATRAPRIAWEHPDLNTTTRITDLGIPSRPETREFPSMQTSIPGLVVSKSTYGKSHEYNLTHADSGLALLNTVPYHVIRKFVDEIKPLGINWELPKEQLLPTIPREVKDKSISLRTNWKEHYGNPVPARVKKKAKSPDRDSALLIDELQSDWGQKSRALGVAGSPETDAAKEVTRRMEGVISSISQELSAVRSKMSSMRQSGQIMQVGQIDSPYAKPRLEERQLLETLEAAQDLIIDQRKASRGVVKGPYVDNTEKWTDLGLKYALKKAVDEKHSHLVFTPSSTQISRYRSAVPSLIDSISVRREPVTGAYQVRASRGNSAVPIDELNNTYSSAKKLASIFPKEIVDMITSNNPDNYIPDQQKGHPEMDRITDNYRYSLPNEIEIGKSGQQFMYDKLIPKRLLALARQHDPDAKLTTYQGKHEPIKGFPALEITPAMAKSIKENGFKAFKRGGAVGDVDHALRVARKARGTT